jgi:hypothetical protein
MASEQKQKLGETLLHKKFPTLHTSVFVVRELKRQRELRKGKLVSVSEKPADKISDFMQVLSRTHLGLGSTDDGIAAKSIQDQQAVLKRIKQVYFRDLVIKPEDVPHRVFELDQQIYIDQGITPPEITEEYKKDKIAQIIANQKDSLERWIDYFTSPDSSYIPTELKYLVWQSISKMGKMERKSVITKVPIMDLDGSIQLDESGNQMTIERAR